jgi:hypothetical protein
LPAHEANVREGDVLDLARRGETKTGETVMLANSACALMTCVCCSNGGQVGDGKACREQS